MRAKVLRAATCFLVFAVLFGCHDSDAQTFTCNVTQTPATMSCVPSGTPPVVNGVCGPSNGGSFNVAPTTGLCTSGAPTTPASTGPTTWGWQCAGSGGGTSTSCSASMTLPPPSGCNTAGGEVMGQGDPVWNPMYANNLFPIPAVTGSGTLGRAVQFIADNVTYPNGIVLNVYDQAPVSTTKNVVISACPHNYTPVGTSGCSKNSATPTFYLSFGGANLSGIDCMLQAGVTYYINFRDYFGQGATVSAQFGASAR